MNPYAYPAPPVYATASGFAGPMESLGQNSVPPMGTTSMAGYGGSIIDITHVSIEVPTCTVRNRPGTLDRYEDPDIGDSLRCGMGASVFALPCANHDMSTVAPITAINCILRRERAEYPTIEAILRDLTLVGVMMDCTGVQEAYGMTNQRNSLFTGSVDGSVLSVATGGSNRIVHNVWCGALPWSTTEHRPAVGHEGSATAPRMGALVGFALIPFRVDGIESGPLDEVPVYPTADELAAHLARFRAHPGGERGDTNICYQIVPWSSDSGLIPTERELTPWVDADDVRVRHAACAFATLGTVNVGFEPSRSEAGPVHFDVRKFVTQRWQTHFRNPALVHVTLAVNQWAPSWVLEYMDNQ